MYNMEAWFTKYKQWHSVGNYAKRETLFKFYQTDDQTYIFSRIYISLKANTNRKGIVYRSKQIKSIQIQI